MDNIFTPSDIAQVVKYRDQIFFTDVTGNMVQDFFRKLEKNKADIIYFYGKVDHRHASFLAPQHGSVGPKVSFSTHVSFFSSKVC